MQAKLLADADQAIDDRELARKGNENGRAIGRAMNGRAYAERDLKR